MSRRPTRDAARSKWRGILLSLGVPDHCLKSKTRNGPCPLCGGQTRFRMDDKDGLGTWICNNCGAGDGVQLVEQFLGVDVKTALARVDEVLGNENIDREPPPPVRDEQAELEYRKHLWLSGARISKGCIADRYFASRRIDEAEYPKSLKWIESAGDGAGGVRPCLLATIMSPENKCVSIHRTFLRPDGGGKAEMGQPRLMTKGEIPDGSAIPLSDPCKAMGIAEGIETAMSASNMFNMPVWAAVNATMLSKWVPPPECEEVAIFGDNDASFTGQAAAYSLAKRLANPRLALTVSVHIPPEQGQDWADVYIRT